MITVNFISHDGETEKLVQAQVGDNLLKVAQAAGLPLEGTCEGQMACSTCHVIIDKLWFDKLPRASEDEEDMLDLASETTNQPLILPDRSDCGTGRYGCPYSEREPEYAGRLVAMRWPNNSGSIKMHLRFALLASWLPILEYVLFRTAYLSLFAIIIVGSCMRY